MPDTLVIDELSLAAINVNSIYFDFGYGFSDTWEEVPINLLQCGSCRLHFLDDVYDAGSPCPTCSLSEHGILEVPECAPMMNYYYTLPYYEGDPEEDQLTLYQSSANVVLIKIVGGDDDEDTYALALSGGGMDLSWDICHAYILLGYAPPLQYCDLPDFAGQDNKKEPFWSILKACLKSANAAMQRATAKTGQLHQRIEAALECPQCHHADRHNRVGGCERIEFDWSSGHCEACRCICTYYPEDRPADAAAMRQQLKVAAEKMRRL